ncbi:hypothetical protein MKX03_002502 [Papaver bracteatum]|nr:hypothetical protein MKX03_002502 [Papaver bracteatum]
MAGIESHRPTRTHIKTSQKNWKQKLREKCLKRIQEDRNHLLWKTRLPSSVSSEAPPSLNQKDIIDSTFRNLVSDELRKMKDCCPDTSTSDDTMLDDAIWEYDGNCMAKATENECEEIMIEMQRIFYEDLRDQQSRAEHAECLNTWEEEEDDYLAQAAFEHLQLSDCQACKRVVWCPICKKGELQENSDLMYCNRCKFRLAKANEVDLEFLRLRLEEAHSEHLDRGCRMTPKFCMETRFNLTALYIQCQSCNTFEIVI